MSTMLVILMSWLHQLVSILPDVISSRVYATLFALRLGLGLHLSAPILEKDVTLAQGNIPASVYTTHSKTPKNVRTMLVVHGLSWTAHKDPRIVNLAEALAAASPSHIVVVPYIRQLAVVDLADGPVKAIQQSIEALASNADLCPNGQVSIVSACISAGLSIVATADMAKKGKAIVDSMFLVGAHADVKNVLQHALDRKGRGDCRYGLYAVYSSFLQPKGNGLSKLLAAYCVDDHLINVGQQSNRVGPLLEEYAEEGKEYKRILDDGEYACKRVIELYAENREAIEYMSSVQRLDEMVNLKFVSLVHSKVDEIVPPNESLILHEAWSKNRDMKVSCVITSLLNHGDQEPITLKHLPEIVRMIDCFSTFFRNVHVDDPSKKVS